MGLFGSLGIIGGAIGSAIKNANKNNSSGKGSGSSGASGSSGSKGSGSSGGAGASSGGYGANTNWKNESNYLNSLAATGTAGQQAWAREQQRKLDAAYQQYNPPTNNSSLGKPSAGNSYGGGAYPSDQFSSPDYYGNAYYENLQRKNDEIRRQQEAANRLAVEQGVSRLEANRGTLNQGYDQAARQAYIAKLQSMKNMPQMLAGQGATGGASESAKIALDSAYGSNLSANEQARQSALTGLDQSIEALKDTGDLNAAQTNLTLQQQQLQDYQNAYGQMVNQNNYLRQFSQAERQQEMEEFRNLLGTYSGDYAMEINRLLAMGVPEDDYRIKMLRAARNEKLANSWNGGPFSQHEMEW